MFSLLALLTSTLLSSFVLGAMQYFVMEQLTGIYGMDDRAWITQAVAATVTVGPALIYFFSGALVSAMKKAYVMALSMAGFSLPASNCGLIRHSTCPVGFKKVLITGKTIFRDIKLTSITDRSKGSPKSSGVT